jgi:hypothetical protein
MGIAHHSFTIPLFLKCISAPVAIGGPIDETGANEAPSATILVVACNLEASPAWTDTSRLYEVASETVRW